MDEFWVRYWHSNAEPLALDGWSAKESFQEQRPEFELQLDTGSEEPDDTGTVDVERFETTIEDWAIGTSAPELLGRLGQSQALRKLPQRYLPHGRLYDYYWEFVAQLSHKAVGLQGERHEPPPAEESE